MIQTTALPVIDLQRIKDARDAELLAALPKQIHAAQVDAPPEPTGAAAPSMPPPQQVDPAGASQQPPVDGPGTDPRLAQADRLTAQAAPPPQPKGFSQNAASMVGGFATAFANPKGYQEVELQKQGMERQREQDLLTRAQQLRQESSQAGQQSFENGRQSGQDYRQGQQDKAAAAQTDLTNKRNATNDASENDVRRATVQSLLYKEKPKMEFKDAPAGSAFGAFDPTTGNYTPKGTVPKDTPTPVDQQELSAYLKNHPGSTAEDFAKFKAEAGQKPTRQVLWGDDPAGGTKQVPFEYDPASGTVKPIGITKTNAGESNAAAKKAEASKGVMDSVTALEGLAKKNTYISDVAMADQFFNVVKPDSGARMNQSYIDKLMTPGPLKNKMTAWAQKLDQGQLLTPQDRQEMIDAAHVVAESKQGPIPTVPGAAAPAAAGGFVKPGGALEGLLKKK